MYPGEAALPINSKGARSVCMSALFFVQNDVPAYFWPCDARRDERGRVVLGDVITAIDGREIKLQRELFEILDEKRPGDKVKVEVLRGDEKRVFDITLGGRDVLGTE